MPANEGLGEAKYVAGASHKWNGLAAGSGAYQTLPGYVITATDSSTPEFHFDREALFGSKNSLSCQIVVDWVIAKTSGCFSVAAAPRTRMRQLSSRRL
jgi:hypothetical protein